MNYYTGTAVFAFIQYFIILKTAEKIHNFTIDFYNYFKTGIWFVVILVKYLCPEFFLVISNF